MTHRRADVVRRLSHWLLLSSFVIGMGFTSFRTMMHVIDDGKENQQADVRKLRELNLGRSVDWKAIPKYFEPVFEARVEGRDLAIRRYSRFKLNHLQVSSNPRVILGRDGWLFYNHEAEPTYFAPPDPKFTENINDWAENMPAWRKWLADRNIRLLIVIAPNKQKIYPDTLPSLNQKLFDDVATRTLKERWQLADPKLHVKDVYAPLFSAALHQQVYFKTDTHWNTDGMLVGYRETVEALGLTPLGPDAFRTGPGPTKVGDLTMKLGYWNQPPEPFQHWELKNPAAKPIAVEVGGDAVARLDYLDAKAWHKPGATGKALVFHDSFGAGLYSELLAEHFGRLVAIPSNHLDPNVIEQEKPDVVILEIVERQFQAIGARGPHDPARKSVAGKP